MTTRFPARRLLLVLLTVSALLRVGLALQGGQFFLRDESRYEHGVAIYQAIKSGDWAGMAAQLAQPEHAAFTFVNVAVAATQHALAQFTSRGDWRQEVNIYTSVDLAAAVLSLFSVLNIWLVYRLARAGGAGEQEAMWAALLTAASNTLFYYSRHLLPYDCALSAALGGLIFAVSGRTPAHYRWSGALAALAYQTYNGYWFLVPVILFAQQISLPDRRTRWLALGPWLTGCLVATFIVVLPGTVCGGEKYWAAMLGFSGTVLQGVFAEGWSLAGEFFCHSEGWLGLTVLAAAVYSSARAFRTGTDSARLRRWLLLLAAIYLLPVIASVGLEKFVVYARTCRPLIPLICLLGGFGFHTLATRLPRCRRWLAGFIMAGALLSFAPHFNRVYPREFAFRVLQQYGVTKDWVSFTGTIYQPLLLPVTRPDLVLVNAVNLYPLRGFQGYPAGEVLLSVDHPLNYLPYQYEGHTPRERRLLRQNRVAMELVRLTHPESVPDHPPPATLFGAADRADGYDHRPPPGR